MRPKHKIYYFRLSASSLVGILNGLLRVDPAVGLSAFIFTYFLVTPLSLRIWKDELKGMGLMEIYKEAIGSSLLALIFFWSLTMSFTGQGVALAVVREKGSGIYPIETLDGRHLPPGNEEMMGYSVVYLNISDHLRDAELGVCLNGTSSFRMGRYYLTVSDIISLRIELKPFDPGDREILRRILGDFSIYRNGTIIFGKNRAHLGESINMSSNGLNISLKFFGPNDITLEMRSPINTSKGSLLNSFIKVRSSDSQLCLFDSVKPKIGRRTISLQGYHIVILPGG
ncbi:MAG: hypothetical protein LM591_01980 [Candidatus Korarchaeum sp.]|nr:hypothetical protein [Candidatus Korarchaeum sp.]